MVRKAFPFVTAAGEAHCQVPAFYPGMKASMIDPYQYINIPFAPVSTRRHG